MGRLPRLSRGRAPRHAARIAGLAREAGGARSFTEISEALSVEINRHKARLFSWFEGHGEVHLQAPWRAALLAHLPRLVREVPGEPAKVWIA